MKPCQYPRDLSGVMSAAVLAEKTVVYPIRLTNYDIAFKSVEDMVNQRVNLRHSDDGTSTQTLECSTDNKPRISA